MTLKAAASYINFAHHASLHWAIYNNTIMVYFSRIELKLSRNESLLVVVVLYGHTLWVHVEL
jgi:hypothetical protein